LLTPWNDGTQMEDELDLRVALKKGAGQETPTHSENAVQLCVDEALEATKAVHIYSVQGGVEDVSRTSYLLETLTKELG